MVDEDITDKDVEDLFKAFGDTKTSVHTFLSNVVKTPDPKRVSNLDKDEIGMPILPVRTELDLALLCAKIPSMSSMQKYFEDRAKITLETALSKEGFLVKQATITRKEFADRTQQKREKGGLFGKKKEEEPT